MTLQITSAVTGSLYCIVEPCLYDRLSFQFEISKAHPLDISNRDTWLRITMICYARTIYSSTRTKNKKTFLWLGDLQLFNLQQGECQWTFPFTELQWAGLRKLSPWHENSVQIGRNHMHCILTYCHIIFEHNGEGSLPSTPPAWATDPPCNAIATSLETVSWHRLLESHRSHHLKSNQLLAKSQGPQLSKNFQLRKELAEHHFVVAMSPNRSATSSCAHLVQQGLAAMQSCVWGHALAWYLWLDQKYLSNNQWLHHTWQPKKDHLGTYSWDVQHISQSPAFGLRHPFHPQPRLEKCQRSKHPKNTCRCSPSVHRQRGYLPWTMRLVHILHASSDDQDK